MMIELEFVEILIFYVGRGCYIFNERSCVVSWVVFFFFNFRLFKKYEKRDFWEW